MYTSDGSEIGSDNVAPVLGDRTNARLERQQTLGMLVKVPFVVSIRRNFFGRHWRL
jgi:hypothetical protein